MTIVLLLQDLNIIISQAHPKHITAMRMMGIMVIRMVTQRMMDIIIVMKIMIMI
jgi:hypothetical protein